MRHTHRARASLYAQPTARCALAALPHKRQAQGSRACAHHVTCAPRAVRSLLALFCAAHAGSGMAITRGTPSASISAAPACSMVGARVATGALRCGATGSQTGDSMTLLPVILDGGASNDSRDAAGRSVSVSRQLETQHDPNRHTLRMEPCPVAMSQLGLGGVVVGVCGWDGRPLSERPASRGHVASSPFAIYLYQAIPTEGGKRSTLRSSKHILVHNHRVLQLTIFVEVDVQARGASSAGAGRCLRAGATAGVSAQWRLEFCQLGPAGAGRVATSKYRLEAAGCWRACFNGVHVHTRTWRPSCASSQPVTCPLQCTCATYAAEIAIWSGGCCARM